jgi:hypothetical protein
VEKQVRTGNKNTIQSGMIADRDIDDDITIIILFKKTLRRGYKKSAALGQETGHGI